MSPASDRQFGIGLPSVGRVVRERLNNGRRVTYEGQIPEDVILTRWKKAGFFGHRLRPNLWWVLGQLPELRKGLAFEEVTRILLEKKLEGGEIAERLPRAHVVVDLCAALLPARLAALKKRHSEGSQVDPRHPGVPDLFLFKRRVDGTPYAVRFVEVKRPGEQIAPHQIAEIRFMRTIGCKVGVVRLIEDLPT